jgi:hypothetical protein
MGMCWLQAGSMDGESGPLVDGVLAGAVMWISIWGQGRLGMSLAVDRCWGSWGLISFEGSKMDS